jgi:hypothetical protein
MSKRQIYPSPTKKFVLSPVWWLQRNHSCPQAPLTPVIPLAIPIINKDLQEEYYDDEEEGYDLFHRRRWWQLIILQWCRHPQRLMFLCLYCLMTLGSGLYVSYELTLVGLNYVGALDQLSKAQEQYRHIQNQTQEIVACSVQVTNKYLYTFDQFYLNPSNTSLRKQLSEMVQSKWTRQMDTCRQYMLVQVFNRVEKEEENNQCLLEVFGGFETNRLSLNLNLAKTVESRMKQLQDVMDQVDRQVVFSLNETMSIIEKNFQSQTKKILGQLVNNGQLDLSSKVQAVIRHKIDLPVADVTKTIEDLDAMRREIVQLIEKLSQVPGVDQLLEIVQVVSNELGQVMSLLKSMNLQQVVDSVGKEMLTSSQQITKEIISSTSTAFQEPIQQIQAVWKRSRQQLTAQLKNLTTKSNDELEDTIQRLKAQNNGDEDNKDIMSVHKQHPLKVTTDNVDKLFQSLSRRKASVTTSQHENSHERLTPSQFVDFVSISIENLPFLQLFYLFFVLDLARIGYRCSNVLIQLITNTFSELPSIDIRQISSIQTMRDFRGIFLCRHDALSLLYTALNTHFGSLFTRVYVIFSVAFTMSFLFKSWQNNYLIYCTNHKDFPIASFNLSQVQPLRYENVSNFGKITWLLIDLPNAAVDVQAEMVFAQQQLEWRNVSQQLHLEALSKRYTAQRLMYDQELTQYANILERYQSCKTLANVSASCTSTLPSIETMLWTRIDDTSPKGTITIGEHEYSNCFPDKNPTVATSNELLQYCAMEKIAYIGFLTWWMWLWTYIALNMVSFMTLQAVALIFWRELSANRIPFTGFCLENGSIQYQETLYEMIQRHLAEVKVHIVLRLLAAVGMIALIIGMMAILVHESFL